MSFEIAAFITVAVIVSLLLAKKVGFKLTKDSISLSADKNKDKDSVSVEDITKKSKISIDEPREDLNIHVKKVEDSVVNIKRKS